MDYSPWCHKESDITEQLSTREKKYEIKLFLLSSKLEQVLSSLSK